MRLLKLRVKNIASLKGEHTLSFEEIAVHSNLFAITGETGAGKSSILNSIGLALYGDIFKRTLNQIDVVTLGEFEGQIELIFQVKGKKYLAYWYVRTRKPNGEAYAKTPTPTRYLYTLNGNDFSDEKTITTEKVEDLLQLDFDQFTKCVILNQGEFAKFLMSSFPERRAILEKLYPGDLLGNVVKVLKEELENLRTQRDHIDIELKAISDDGVGIVNIEEEIKTATRELSLHESWSEFIEKLNERFNSLSHYHQSNLDNLARSEKLKAELSLGTTAYNVLLKATEELGQKKETAQKVHDERAPRLQELLKSEEQLIREKDALSKLLADEGKKTAESAECKKQITKHTEEESKYQAERTERAKKMKHAPELIIPRRDLINKLLDLNDEIEKLKQNLEFERKLLQEQESRGKLAAQNYQDLQAKLKAIPEDSHERLKSLQKKKEDSRKTDHRLADITKQLDQLEKSISDADAQLKDKNIQLHDSKEELTTILSSLKVQELLSAVSVCLFHPQTETKGTCPVCDTPFAGDKLLELRKIAGGLNTGRLQEKEGTLKSAIVKLETEITLLSKSIGDNRQSLATLNEEKKSLSSSQMNPETIDAEISLTQKNVWDRDQLTPQVKTSESELTKARQEYAEASSKLKNHEAQLETKSKAFTESSGPLREVLPDFQLAELRADVRLSTEVSELDGQLSRVKNDLRHGNSKLTELTTLLETLSQVKKETEAKVAKLSELLTKELAGVSAATLLRKIGDDLRIAQSEFETKDRERQKQDLELKSFQGRLTTMEEQNVANNIHFTKEHKEITELAGTTLPELSENLTRIQGTLRKLDLSLNSAAELFVPVKDVLAAERTNLKTITNEARSKLAHLQAKRSEQEKKRDRIQLLELKRADIMKDLNRRERMNEILGKDELRTYVLSLVEENLIIVTNDELSRLCQGRYEIIHQTKTSKLAPEFFVLDKFRDGGIRKVSTLSGGETFMVSLAMALGLAEMTRGTAEIDTLFIDEGFGTLDHESLEDVLDVLNQIQNRGLMVGIISHIKQLTDSLPVKVLLSKKRDGTSTVSLKLD